MSHREDLLDAARRLLVRQGYARTTARDLVAASDTNLASIGYHFGSKDALLQQAMSELFMEWGDQLAAAALAPEGAGPMERLTASWTQMLDSFEAHRPLAQAWMEALSQAARSPALQADLAAHYDRSRAAVAGAVRAALGDDAVALGADPDLIAAFLIAVCDGLLLQYLLDPSRRPDGQALAAAVGAAIAAGAPAPAPGAAL